MYFKPKNPDSLVAWRNTWINYILSYAQQRNIHVINLTDLRREHPFNKMDVEAFEDLINSLIDKGFGMWWGKSKKEVRIYWRSLERWAEELVQLAKDKEKLVIIGTKDLTLLEPKLTTMPKRDLEEILNIMVQREHAHWINKYKKIIKLE